jgi:Flp pilus assembly protein TadG
VTEEVYNSTPNSSGGNYSSTLYGSWAACRALLPSDSGWVNNGSSTTSTATVTIGTSNVTQTTVSQPQAQRYYLCSRNGNGYSVYYYDAYRTYKTYSYATTKTVSGTSSSTAFDHYDYRPVDYDVSRYKTGNTITIPTGSSGASVSATWAGCIEERFTVPSGSIAYSSTSSAITPTTALDLDIDSAPTSDPATQWSPMMPEAGYYRSSSSSLVSTSGSSGGTYCPAEAMGLQEMSQSNFNAYVNTLSANGGTYHDIGMLWGRAVLTHGHFSSTVNTVPSNGGKVSRHIIFMTDGIPQPTSASGLWHRDQRQAHHGRWIDRRRQPPRNALSRHLRRGQGQGHPHLGDRLHHRPHLRPVLLRITQQFVHRHVCQRPEHRIPANRPASVTIAGDAMIRRLIRDETGGPMMEFALIAPTFLILVLGAANVSQMVYGKTLLNGAVEGAARNSALSGASTDTQDANVKAIVGPVLPGATYAITRKRYYDFTDIARKESGPMPMATAPATTARSTSTRTAMAIGTAMWPAAAMAVRAMSSSIPWRSPTRRCSRCR